MKHWVNNFFGLLLGLLGFSSCFPKMYGPPDFREEYGVPHATYKLNAEATDEEGNPVEGIRVVVAPNGEESDWKNDTLYTDKAGKAELQRLKYTWPSTDQMKVVFDDVDGAEHGSFESTTLYKYGLDIQKTGEGSGNWDQGSFTITAKAKLKKK